MDKGKGRGREMGFREKWGWGREGRRGGKWEGADVRLKVGEE